MECTSADEYTYVIVGGPDAGCNLSMKYFTQIGALQTNRFFDENRKGFVMGEGAGIPIIQSEEQVEKYKPNLLQNYINLAKQMIYRYDKSRAQMV